MTESHEPMEVSFVPIRKWNGEPVGEYVDPQLHLAWTDLDKLRWKAGVVEAKTGLVIRIVTGVAINPDTGDEIPGQYGYSTTGRGGGAYDYHGMWTWLSGVQAGWELAQKEDA